MPIPACKSGGVIWSMLWEFLNPLMMPGWFCAGRVFARMWRGERRAEMPDGCVDRFSWRTLNWVFLSKERLFIDNALRAATLKKYVCLRTPRDAANWLKQI